MTNPLNEEAKAAVIATKSVGGAVERNRAKRLLREAIDTFFPVLKPACDIILIARKPIVDAELEDVTEALRGLLQKANLLNPPE